MIIEYSLNRVAIDVDVFQSSRLIALLNQCPSHMKNLSHKERFLETLSWIFSTLGFLLESRPQTQTITIADFVAKIKASHDESNPQTSYAIAVLEALEPAV